MSNMSKHVVAEMLSYIELQILMSGTCKCQEIKDMTIGNQPDNKGA